jgi:hypothetical protein
LGFCLAAASACLQIIKLPSLTDSAGDDVAEASHSSHLTGGVHPRDTQCEYKNQPDLEAFAAPTCGCWPCGRPLSFRILVSCNVRSKLQKHLLLCTNPHCFVFKLFITEFDYLIGSPIFITYDIISPFFLIGS